MLNLSYNSLVNFVPFGTNLIPLITLDAYAFFNILIVVSFNNL